MLLGCNFLMVFFSLTYFMLLPGFAKDVLNAGPDDLGLLISLSGIGSLLGSLYVASFGNRKRARLLLIGGLLMGVSLLVCLVDPFWLSMCADSGGFWASIKNVVIQRADSVLCG